VPGPDFTETTKRMLREQVCCLCSYPGCEAFTVQAKADGESNVILGDAAHIEARNKGAARYNETMTDEARRHISNGIWLCKPHHTLVDNDRSPHTVDVLRQWKRDMLERVRGNAPFPMFPVLSIRTSDALVIREERPPDQSSAREHALRIRNPSRLEWTSIRLKLQLPEPVEMTPVHRSVPPGTACEFPVEPEPLGSVGPGIPFTRVAGRAKARANFTIALDLLRPGEEASWILRSGTDSPDTYPGDLVQEHRSGTVLRYFLTGSYQFYWKDLAREFRFASLLDVELAKRWFTSGEVVSQLDGRMATILESDTSQFAMALPRKREPWTPNQTIHGPGIPLKNPTMPPRYVFEQMRLELHTEPRPASDDGGENK
jgi:hypothetical protein